MNDTTNKETISYPPTKSEECGYEIHFPTEQYGFILKKMSGDDDDAVEAYKSLARAWNPSEELSTKDFNKFLDNQLMGEPNEMETYQAMSDGQKNVVQENKKALKRIAAKQQ